MNEEEVFCRWLYGQPPEFGQGWDVPLHRVPHRPKKKFQLALESDQLGVLFPHSEMIPERSCSALLVILGQLARKAMAGLAPGRTGIGPMGPLHHTAERPPPGTTPTLYTDAITMMVMMIGTKMEMKMMFK